MEHNRDQSGEEAAKAERPRPSLARMEAALGSPAAESASLTFLAVLALLYSLYFAREFLVPITFAVLLHFLLSPVIRALARWKLPPPLAAAIVLTAVLGALGGGIYALSGPAERWATTAPESVRKAGTKVRALIRPVQRVTNNVERAAGAVDSEESKPQQVVVTESGGMLARLSGTTSHVLGGILEIVILTYFFLAGGDLFLQKLIKVIPSVSDKQKAIEIARSTEGAVSTYLTTALLVNLAEGAVVAGVLWLLKMPNAPLWGALVACFEFVPYLGAAAAVAILTVAALTTFNGVARALLVPASYLVVNLVQANIVSPILLGHRLTLNPVAIFVGLAFFFWIWGVAGAFLAIPLLATFKIFCDNIEALAAVGEFLGQRDSDERRVLVREDGG